MSDNKVTRVGVVTVERKAYTFDLPAHIEKWVKEQGDPDQYLVPQRDDEGYYIEWGDSDEIHYIKPKIYLSEVQAEHVKYESDLREEPDYDYSDTQTQTPVVVGPVGAILFKGFEEADRRKRATQTPK